MAKEKTEQTDIEKRIAAVESKHKIDKAEIANLVVTSSGSYMVDMATQIGGIPLGKVIEIWGQESCGKSTLVLHITAQFQKAFPNKKVALFDYEHSYDVKYAKKLGVDVDNLLIYQPDSQEQGYNLILGLIEADVISLAIIDSHTSAIPEKIIESDIGDATMGISARNNSTFLGKVKSLLDAHKTTLIGVSQTRANIGGMGDNNITTGGNSWKFYSDMRFKMWKTNDKVKELNSTTLDVVKSKVGKPFGKAEFNINWGQGIDNMQEILDLAIEQEIIKQGGSWFSYGDMKIGQGAIKAKEFLADNGEILGEILGKLKMTKD